MSEQNEHSKSERSSGSPLSKTVEVVTKVHDGFYLVGKAQIFDR